MFLGEEAVYRNSHLQNSDTSSNLELQATTLFAILKVIPHI